ncbi:MAG: YifB family Mg chelatase-like AAA ATPase [Burkholderiaceae bacterium]|nr:YifB family Mg chelatase-like AAA ATPase [Microbacteriaceae bacterium]
MSMGRTSAVALFGLAGSLVDVEAHTSNGLPAFVLIGLPDAALNEARDRVRAALATSGCEFPRQRLTVNLSPASLPKHGSAFDLAIAIAVLVASGSVGPASVHRVVHLGELGLDGRLRPVAGILPSVLAARGAGATTVMVPAGNAGEAALVPGVRVVPVASLRDAAIWHGGAFDAVGVEPVMPPAAQEQDRVEPELADVIGNSDAVEALQVAAAGGHHVFLLGPPGAGKTMLAARLPGILPDLEADAALEASSIRSLSGVPVSGSLLRRPPFEAPHHTSSAASIVGAGSGIIRPGAAVRACHGVLFMDEAPEFATSALDALRQPLESGQVSIHRASAVARFPARFQLVLAANPCPCGQYGARDSECVCPPASRRRYLARLSGPLLDRIDIQLRVARISSAHVRLDTEARHTTTAAARARVTEARAATATRLRGTPWTLNSQVPGPWLRGSQARLGPSTTAAIDRALERGGLTMRGYDRVLRLAWTISDLDGTDRPGADQLGRALYLRRAISV